MLVGNKTDLAEHSAIKDEAVEQLARQLGGVQTFKCSAKDGSGVDEIFNALTEAIIKKVGSSGPKPANDPNVVDPTKAKEQGSGSGCC